MGTHTEPEAESLNSSSLSYVMVYLEGGQSGQSIVIYSIIITIQTV